MRLFCFPYAGGNITLFHSWSRQLPASVEVCAAQLPGRGNRLREAPFTSLQPLVESLGQAISPLLQKPFAFFGHSMGALIAFELARYLRREKGVSPRHLFVSGRRAPQSPQRESPIYNLPQQEFIEELRRLEGTPAEVLDHPELMELMTPLLRADFTVVDTYEYVPELPLECGITAYGGLQDHEVSLESLEAWRELTRGRFILRMLPGGHFFVQSGQELLLRSLNTELHQLVMRSFS
ncbi:MAG: thioesterase II family protein [Acidobacteria bacterium]|nr:thioesterase II family protein [Acidobacteriota bacterium]